MKLTNKALESINTKRGRLALMTAMDFSEQWVFRVLKANKVNGPLTTATALKVIEQETGLTQEDILENVVEGAAR
jgi:hypothetical protein